MGETSIQWTSGPNGEPGYTFNPWVGCQRVSPGCEHCYAEAYDKRVGGAMVRDESAGVGMTYKTLRWGPTNPRVRTSAANWRKPLKWNAEAAAAGHRRKVFCASLADVFEDRPELESWRLDLFNLIDATPHLDWLLLTKRPENIERLTPWRFYRKDPRPNVWLGCTVEDRQRAKARIPHLVAAPAVVHFLSCEPMLEGLGDIELHGIDWIIIGGESGGGARPFKPAWARTLMFSARKRSSARVFVKQLGAHIIDRNDAGFEGVEPSEWPGALEYGGHIRVEHDLDGYRDDYQGAPVRVHLRDRAGGDPAEWPEDLRVREFPEVRRG